MSTSQDNSQNNSSTAGNAVHVDNIGRVHLGALRTSSKHYPAAGERYLEQLKATVLVAVVRRGKGNQWFAALEDRLGETIAFSEDLGSESAAKDAATAALSLLKS